MRTFIIEDEKMARDSLRRTLVENFPDIEIVGEAGSVEEAVAFLKENGPDIIFMDVELSDGKCFEIFRQVEVKAHVIMTTAYDSYAVQAFEVNSIDYLLKPIEIGALRRAVERCRQAESSADMGKIIEAISSKGDKAWKERFLVHLNDRIVPVKTSQVAYFFSEAKDNHLVTRDGTTYILDSSMDTISSEVNPEHFFRVSRGCIIAKDSVESVTKLLGGRLKIILPPYLTGKGGHNSEFIVARARVDDFLRWLEK